MSTEFSSVVLQEAVRIWIDLSNLADVIYLTHETAIRIMLWFAIIAVGLWVEFKLAEDSAQ